MRASYTPPLILFLLLLLIYPPPSSPATAPLLSDAVLGLIVFKAALQDTAGALSTWSPDDSSPCGWAHVDCASSSGAIDAVVGLSLSSLSLSSSSGLPRGLDLLPFLRSISLSSNNLSGPLPSPFPYLPRLSSLDLSSNSLSGSLPPSLLSHSLPSLRSIFLQSNSFSGPLAFSLFTSPACASLRLLDLSSNSLNGPIPESISHCSLLLHLNLSCNSFSGDPFSVLSFLPRLRILDLSHNSLSGPIPNSIASLHHLKLLRLSGNQLFGQIPFGIAFLPHLLTLELAGNQLSDNLPSWFTRLTALQRLDLSSNSLTGEIPSDLSALEELRYLSLAGNSLSGGIPASLADLSKLTELRLGHNVLNGSIPPKIFDLELQVLDLVGNNLAGTLPPISAKLAKALQWLDLAGNGFTGKTSPEIVFCSNLQYLNLSWNNLDSPVPPELGDFKNLSVLDLRSSGIYGQIPADLCNSGSLRVLQLDGNGLSGRIPDEIGNCSVLHLLSLSHNNLTGNIPAAMAELKKLEILKLEYNYLSGEIPQDLGTLSNLVAVNISNNRLAGRLPASGVFPSLDPSALRGNLGLCSPLVAEPCKMDDVPKPLVLDPNTINQGRNHSRANPAASSPAEIRHRRRLLSLSAMIAIAAAFFIIIGIMVVCLLNISARRRLEKALESICSSSSRSGSTPAVGKWVIFDTLQYSVAVLAGVSADGILSKATEIGRGAFGIVYRAAFAGDSRPPVAIRKMVSHGIIGSHEDFDREVRAMAKALHPNLLSVKGYYWTPQLQLLITQFAAGGSLHFRLHGSGAVEASLSWAERFNIALGAARGLAHLHRAFRTPVIHYNVKPSNILLDGDGNAMVADFGMALLLPSEKFAAATAAGGFGSSMGYAAPELACQSVRVSEKCDVYGFGVVLLELVTGRQAVEVGDDETVVLADVVRTVLERGEAAECVDRRMGEFPEEEVLPVLKLGVVCASLIPSSRPTMAEVVQILQVIKTPVVERMAAFSWER
ncbi:inactive leucine-rich repeat receptor-like protein kinase [Apostasia shenzhenica]|uniref:Inactive leucine-rich repeat receptor-like protein kinase n=1 Tax=Apostasia shenzhenica TaxID=1088818 RepID=A0A2I0BEA9_9ASPA|nr:inactive leucine-rich repeat receptor-like protein kinase [Apostasia shenzhenica]